LWVDLLKELQFAGRNTLTVANLLLYNDRVKIGLYFWAACDMERKTDGRKIAVSVRCALLFCDLLPHGMLEVNDIKKEVSL
jgi:hypothetical protein